MTKEDLSAMIADLRIVAEGLDGFEEAAKLSVLDRLDIKLASMVLSDVVQKLQSVSLPDMNEMNSEIEAAKAATASHDARVATFDKAYGFIKTALLNIAL